MESFIPQQPLHLLAIIPSFLLWWLTRARFKRRNASIYHNSSLAVSFWEEALFRGLIYSLVAALTGSAVAAVIVSSLLFGLFHLRNLWWADKCHVITNCLYTSLIVGPLLALLRFWSGDIYLGILVHFLHNCISMLLAKNLPTDDYLQSVRHRQNWFQKLFSGDWLR